MDYDAWNDPARWQYETAEPDEPREIPAYTLYDLAAEMEGALWKATFERAVNGR